MDNVLKSLEQLRDALAKGNEELAQQAANDLDVQLKALTTEEIESNADLLAEVNESLLEAIRSAKASQKQTREEIVKFTSNTNKLKAYQIPR